MKSGNQKHDEEDRATYPETGEKRYQWPPVRDPNLSYKTKSRNPAQSIITALPLIMLVAGFMIYYLTESRQTQGEPIRAESIELAGVFTGFSTTADRHYLWVDIEGVAKGIRIESEQVSLLENLVRDESVQLQVAPRVSGSTTYWAWQIKQSDVLFLDEQSMLR